MSNEFTIELISQLRSSQMVINNRCVYKLVNNTYYIYLCLFQDLLDSTLNLFSSKNKLSHDIISEYDNYHNSNIPNILKPFLYSFNPNIICLNNKLYNLKTNLYVDKLPLKIINNNTINDSSNKYSICKFISSHIIDDNTFKFILYVIGGVINGRINNTKPIAIYGNQEVITSLYNALKLIKSNVNLVMNSNLNNNENLNKSNLYFTNTLPSNYNIYYNIYIIDLSYVHLDKALKLKITVDDVIKSNKIYNNNSFTDIDSLYCTYLFAQLKITNPLESFINTKCKISNKNISKVIFKKNFLIYSELFGFNYTNYSEMFLNTINKLNLNTNKSYILNLELI